MIINNEIAKTLVGLSAIIYCRVSTKEQTEGTSLDDQEAICLAFTKKYKMDVVKIYREDASATRFGQRKKFNSMVEDIRNREAQIIICSVNDRLSRNDGDFCVIEELVEYDGAMVAIAVDEVILKSPLLDDELFSFDVKNLMAKREARLIKQRCKAGILAKHLQGFRPTRVPYGYFNDKGNNTAIVMKDRASFVLKAYELYATGDFTISALASELYSQGYKYELSPEGRVPKQSLYTILRNIFYTGEFVVKRTGDIQKGNHEAIVPIELFEKVQTILDLAPKSPRKNDLLYQQFLKSEMCGRYMTGDVKRKGEKQYVYYVCKNKDCTKKCRTTEVQIDSDVSNYLKELRLEFIPSEVAQNVLKDVLYTKNQKLAIMKRQRGHRYAAEQKVYERITKNNIVDEKYIRGEYAKIQEKYGDLESKIYNEETQIAMIQSAFKDVLKKNLNDVFITMDRKTKRKVLELVTNSFKLAEKGLKMTYKPAFRKIRKR